MVLIYPSVGVILVRRGGGTILASGGCSSFFASKCSSSSSSSSFAGIRTGATCFESSAEATVKDGLTRHARGSKTYYQQKTPVLLKNGNSGSNGSSIRQQAKQNVRVVSRYGIATGRSFSSSTERHGTTIICVRKNGQVTMMGDGMVSMGNLTVKPNARKIRVIQSKSTQNTVTTSVALEIGSDDNNSISSSAGITLVGFAGSTADAFTLLERLEGKLDEYPRQLMKSCVELAKGWRTDKYLRQLNASLLVADNKRSFELTGNGDVLESHDDVLSVGSGSPYALAAARALMTFDELSSEEVAKRSMDIASDMCVYTNKCYTIETIDSVSVVDDEEENDSSLDK